MIPKKKLRIGILAPSVFMSPTRYPTRIFAPRDLAVHLADTLISRGHDVTMFCPEDVQTNATIVPSNLNFLSPDFHWEKERTALHVRRTTKREVFGTMHIEFELLARAYKRASQGEVDLFHSFHSFGENQHGSHYLEEVTGFPTVYTLHNPLPEQGTPAWHFLSRWKNHRFISISFAQRQGMDLHFIGTVHNGVRLTDYTFVPEDRRSSGYVAWMGRVFSKKGLNDALLLGKRLGETLHFAPKYVNGNGDPEYVERVINPLLSHCPHQGYPFLQGRRKDKFLGGARAFLFPIHWDEPFGMTMIEAMATGTPVVAFGRGAVPEVVINGKTGFIVPESDGIEGLMKAVRKIDALSSEEYQAMRRRCREHVEAHFTVEHMAAGYEAIYRRILEKRN